MTLDDWLALVSGPTWFRFAKILAANDTLATGAHQAGLYLPKAVTLGLMPSLDASHEANPRVSIPATIDSHGAEADVRAIWYRQGTRDETRLTGWGGRSSPILDPEATGSLCILAFEKPPRSDATRLRVWLCSEDDLGAAEAALGVVEPGAAVLQGPDGFSANSIEPGCRFSESDLSYEWRLGFPDGEAIVAHAAGLAGAGALSTDDRLLARRECEFAIFRVLEAHHALPTIRRGFDTVERFVEFAHRVTNRRKARSGRSLELHMRRILDEADVRYSHGQISENAKRPDFLFPSAERYRDPRFSSDRLRMLAVKTTCKDRWRQILNEADRIRPKHLLTLQEGVSMAQFEEMERAGVVLVVPRPLHKRYPTAIRGRLLSLDSFVETVRDGT